MRYFYLVPFLFTCLLRSMDSNYSNGNLATLLGNAVFNENTEEINRLIKQGAKPDDVADESDNEHNITPLHVAAHYNKSEALKILLACKDINCNVTDTDGDTPLVFAVLGKCPETVKILLEHGAHANCPFLINRVLAQLSFRDTDTQTVRDQMAKVSAVIVLLKKHNFTTHAQDQDGYTCLYVLLALINTYQIQEDLARCSHLTLVPSMDLFQVSAPHADAQVIHAHLVVEELYKIALLLIGPDIDLALCNHEGTTILEGAGLNGCTRFARMLITSCNFHQARPEVLEKIIVTLKKPNTLQKAFLEKIDTAKTLVHGTDVSAKDKQAARALIEGLMKNGPKGTVKLLRQYSICIRLLTTQLKLPHEIAHLIVQYALSNKS